MNTVKKAALVLATAGLAAGAAAGTAFADGSQADGKAVHSPGVLSGNLVQAPVDAPVNVSGNSINVVGVLNSAFANGSLNY
ncbi:chaplin [Streptomyces gilvosporeus]|uniref:Chaplin n=1 Tax=Streptomyces gilvosporeus TaxID=553510 RepID=A0A1V0TP12_9ACTN|nr:chaplin [Streptomyces gilvosporeus]ARF54675.1 chaplin [Streptomyces gilvosporeus]